MSDDKSIYEIKLHEKTYVDAAVSVRRVPGGWIYFYKGAGASYTSCFVPYHKEFYPEKEE